MDNKCRPIYMCNLNLYNYTSRYVHIMFIHAFRLMDAIQYLYIIGILTEDSMVCIGLNFPALSYIYRPVKQEMMLFRMTPQPYIVELHYAGWREAARSRSVGIDSWCLGQHRCRWIQRWRGCWRRESCLVLLIPVTVWLHRNNARWKKDRCN